MSGDRWTIHLTGASLPDKALIGGKAWSIARMRSKGLHVPPAFVITTDACRDFLEFGALPSGLEAEVDAGIAFLEQATQRNFGGSERPLLVSVRSGAALSMPGMMDTVLNLGMNDLTEAALARESALPAFARDTHRRFVELYASIVLKTPLHAVDADADPEKLHAQVREAGQSVPDSPKKQLLSAIEAVFNSWNGRRARRYREHNDIPHTMGTAVTVQSMVFGNLDERSGTGVVFSRNPLSGEPTPFGEYLPRAQGEDVVSGKFTPQPLEVMQVREPQAYSALLTATALLEREQGDIQDIEFTVQAGELYLLQTRSAKRSPAAAVRAAVDMVDEGMIDADTALSRVSPEQILSLLLPRLKDGEGERAAILARGEGACPGVATGVFVRDPDEAERRAAAGEAVILVRKTTSPDDIHGMIAARAIVTEQGGATSHAAVVSRALGRPCVVGVVDATNLHAGGVGTVDGAGIVYAGELAAVAPREADDRHLNCLIEWARERSDIEVLRPAEAHDVPECVDVDARMAGLDVDQLSRVLSGAVAARGHMLAAPEFARRAAALGLKTLVTEPILPALLALRKEAR